MGLPLHRTLDACLNRALEGLRVLMDVARFEFDDPTLSKRLKDQRHRLHALFRSNAAEAERLLASRESGSDVSRPAETAPPSPSYPDLASLIEANARRVQEALRTLEEFSRVEDPVRAREVERLRYEAYDLHPALSTLAGRYSHAAKMDFELYVVTDERLSKGRPVTEIVRHAISGGAGCIQLREKRGDARAVLAQARELAEICRGEGATFIVNDRLDIALESGADGVHLGQEDLPLAGAKKLSGGGLIVGVSTHSREQGLEAQSGGAGYINIGPIFPTETKGVPVHPVKPDLVREMRPLLHVPFTTMGGIHLDNVEEVVLAGADRIAVVSEVVSADDVESAAKRMVEAIRLAKEKRLEIEAKDS